MRSGGAATLEETRQEHNCKVSNFEPTKGTTFGGGGTNKFKIRKGIVTSSQCHRCHLYITTYVSGNSTKKVHSSIHLLAHRTNNKVRFRYKSRCYAVAYGPLMQCEDHRSILGFTRSASTLSELSSTVSREQMHTNGIHITRRAFSCSICTIPQKMGPRLHQDCKTVELQVQKPCHGAGSFSEYAISCWSRSPDLPNQHPRASSRAHSYSGLAYEITAAAEVRNLFGFKH
jgi:hypothetical protein